jgi:hypothetical protein
MAGVIATLLANSKNISSTIDKGPGRHVYNELVALQTIADPTLAAPYAAASHVAVIPNHTDTISSGNFTITIGFPMYGVSVTTGNIAYDAAEAAIQTAVDTALDGSSVIATYNAGDVDVALTGNLTANDATITANGATVNGAYMTVTTANVDLDADNLGIPSNTTLGTLDSPAEAFLKHFGVIAPASAPIPHGAVVAASNYVLLNEGDISPHSLSPALLDAVVRDVAAEEQPVNGGTESGLSNLFRSMIGCI